MSTQEITEPLRLTLLVLSLYPAKERERWHPECFDARGRIRKAYHGIVFLDAEILQIYNLSRKKVLDALLGMKKEEKDKIKEDVRFVGEWE